MLQFMELPRVGHDLATETTIAKKTRKQELFFANITG